MLGMYVHVVRRKKKEKNNNNIRRKQKKKRLTAAPMDSCVVPHRSTNRAALWLTAQIRRDAVLSESYGRRHSNPSKSPYIPSPLVRNKKILARYAGPWGGRERERNEKERENPFSGFHPAHRAKSKRPALK